MKNIGIAFIVILIFSIMMCFSVPAQEHSVGVAKSVIQDAQLQLKSLGYEPGVADGALGTKTTNAVKKFQSDHRLPVTGILSPDTLTVLNQAADMARKRGMATVNVDPKANEDADWAKAYEKSTPASFWEFSEKYPQSERVQIVHGRITTKFAYMNTGNGMEPHSWVVVGGQSYPLTESEMRQWKFIRYEHTGKYLFPTSGGAIADGTAMLVMGTDGKYRIVDIQGEVAGGGTDPFKPTLQISSNTVRVGQLEWQLEAAPRVMKWEDAKSYCSTVSLEGSGGGWRLPTQPELAELYTKKSTIPGVNSELGIIASLNAGRYWTSSTSSGSVGYAQEVDFDNGTSSDDAVAYNYNVRCVR